MLELVHMWTARILRADVTDVTSFSQWKSQDPTVFSCFFRDFLCFSQSLWMVGPHLWVKCVKSTSNPLHIYQFHPISDHLWIVNSCQFQK